jgi:hypothetical protein
MHSFYMLIKVPDPMLVPQLSTPKDLPRFDTSESFDPGTQCLAGLLTTDLVSGIMDTETNFDWVRSHSSNSLYPF